MSNEEHEIDKADAAYIEQQAAFFGMLMATYLTAPEADTRLQDILLYAVVRFAKQHEIDACEVATATLGAMAMRGVQAPHDLERRIELLGSGSNMDRLFDRDEPYWAVRTGGLPFPGSHGSGL